MIANESFDPLIGAHLDHILATDSPASTHAARALCLTLKLVCLTVLLLLCGSLLASNDNQNVAQRLLPCLNTVGNLAPLLLSKDTVGGAVDEENLLLLGELSLDEAGADNVDNPHLDVGLWDLEALGDACVWDLLVWGGGGKGGEGHEAHFAVEDGGVEVVVAEEGVVLVTEVVVVLELLLRKDIEEVGPDWLGLGESLDGWEGVKVVEVEVGAGEEGGLESAEGERGGLLGCKLSGVIGLVCAKSTEEILV